jgi:carbon monoxide dehydrogenase subunit G
VSRAGPRVAAERVVAAPVAAVFGFLADLENHWLLTDRFVEVLTLDRSPDGGPAHGGKVRIRGPLGLTRTADTRVAEADPPHSIAGTAAVGRRTEAGVRWTLAPEGQGTRVRLEALVRQAGPLEALLLAVGGRRWLGRRFEAILATLARRMADAQASSA